MMMIDSLNFRSVPGLWGHFRAKSLLLTSDRAPQEQPCPAAGKGLGTQWGSPQGLRLGSEDSWEQPGSTACLPVSDLNRTLNKDRAQLHGAQESWATSPRVQVSKCPYFPI